MGGPGTGVEGDRQSEGEPRTIARAFTDGRPQAVKLSRESRFDADRGLDWRASGSSVETWLTGSA